MIIELMFYTSAISLILGLVALAIERAFALAVWPRRWLWAAAMVLSLGGSAAMSLLPHASYAAAHRTTISRLALPLSQNTSPAPLAGAESLQRSRFTAPPWPVLEGYAGTSWIATSMLLLGFYLSGALHLVRARRKWPRQVLGRHAVLVSHNVGPAVFGLLHPAIVVPQWLLEQPLATRDAALLHEEQHVAARDHVLLMAALLWLALTPWNLPLWWQLRRLRLALEVDCDGRVLRAGVERRHYLDTLICINQYSGEMLLGAVAIVGRASQLEQRIRAMTAKRPRHIRLWMAGWAAAAVPLLVLAAQLDPPASAPARASQSAAPHAHLGIGLADFDVNSRATSISSLEHQGALVTYVETGDVGDQAGLKRGDVVVKFGTTAIDGASTLATVVAHTAASARMPLVVHRGASDLHLTADFSLAPAAKPPFGGKPVDGSDWDTLRDGNMAIGQPQVRDELVRMARLDEMLRVPPRVLNLPVHLDTGYIVPGPQVDPADSAANVRRLHEIVTQYGWPTVSMVGVRGATAAGLIALSASDDPTFQTRVLALMEPLVPLDEVPALYYATLFDTVHTPQRFGMKLACKHGVMTPEKPIEDPRHLEQRRAALGLPKQPSLCVSMVDAKTPP